MRRILTLLLIVSLFSSQFLASVEASSPKAGSSCKTLKSSLVFNGNKYICVRLRNQLVWSHGIKVSQQILPIPGTAPTTSPTKPPESNIPSTLPTGFRDLYENRKAIAYAAWLKTSTVIAGSDARIPLTQIFIGPNTTPWYTNIRLIEELDSKAFPTAKLPSKVFVFFYNYRDLNWAMTEVKAALSADEYDQLNANEGGHLVDSGCQPLVKDCLGSKEVTTSPGSDTALLLIGVHNHSGMYTVNGTTYGDPGVSELNFNGLLLAHEYFHAIQREPFQGKSVSQGDYPPPWLREGSAQFIQIATVYHDSYSKFLNWKKISVGGYIKNQGLSESFISDYLSLKHFEDNWSSFNGDWAYFLGHRIVEALVAVKGPESLVDLYTKMSSRIGFESAFSEVYGISYEDVVPILAKVISANFASGD
jgi:hypothetical protein